MTWNLKLNPLKCETILFRITARYCSKPTRLAVNNFKTETTIPGSNVKTAILHKNNVKSLNVVLDYLLKGNIHTKKQLQKAHGVLYLTLESFSIDTLHIEQK